MSTDRLQGKWRVVRYLAGDEMVGPSPLGNEPPHLIVEADRVAGSMGVNRLIGEMSADGLAGPLATTMMAGPPELMEQETTLLGLLQEADAVDVDVDRLLFSKAGEIVLEMEREAGDADPSERMQGVWIVTNYLSGEELVEPVAEGRRPGLTIDGDRVSGTMGVNRVTGQLGPRGLPGPLATTRMAGPPTAMEQESVLLRHLHDANSVEFDETGMSWSKDGLTIVKFSRSGTNESRDPSQ
jgi:heat shock protein HslJ